MTDQFELPSGLPEGPWTPSGFEVRVNDRSLALVSSSWPQPYRIVSAIASIPAMVEEIERLQQQNETVCAIVEDLTAERKSLRALNAEMRDFIHSIRVLCCGDALREEARAILAKSQEASS